MLAQFHKWKFENKEYDSVSTLRKWVLQESEYYKIAHETNKGLLIDEKVENSYFTKSDNQTNLNCHLCQEKHDLKSCSIFKNMTTDQRWDVAKKNRLCFRCLRRNHRIGLCTTNERCSICNSKHHTLLHSKENWSKSGIGASESGALVYPGQKEPLANISALGASTDTGVTGSKSIGVQSITNTVENDRTMLCSNTTFQSHKEFNYIALRTVPVILHKDGREIAINALLDDASTRSYINSGIAEQLNSIGNQTSTLSVSVLNGNRAQFKTNIAEFDIISQDRHSKTKISAYTTDNVTAGLESIDWCEHKSKYKHLNEIEFPRPTRQKVDLLIGLDHMELHNAIKEVHGEIGEPIARLTPLGWTAIGKIRSNDTVSKADFSNFSFIMKQTETNENRLMHHWKREKTSARNVKFEKESLKNWREKPTYSIDCVAKSKVSTEISKENWRAEGISKSPDIDATRLKLTRECRQKWKEKKMSISADINPTSSKEKVTTSNETGVTSTEKPKRNWRERKTLKITEGEISKVKEDTDCEILEDDKCNGDDDGIQEEDEECDGVNEETDNEILEDDKCNGDNDDRRKEDIKCDGVNENTDCKILENDKCNRDDNDIQKEDEECDKVNKDEDYEILEYEECDGVNEDTDHEILEDEKCNRNDEDMREEDEECDEVNEDEDYEILENGKCNGDDDDILVDEEFDEVNEETDYEILENDKCNGDDDDIQEEDEECDEFNEDEDYEILEDDKCNGDYDDIRADDDECDGVNEDEDYATLEDDKCNGDNDDRREEDKKCDRVNEDEDYEILEDEKCNGKDEDIQEEDEECDYALVYPGQRSM